MRLLLFLLSLLSLQAQAQRPVAVFPDLQGQALLDSLVLHYKPSTVLGYGEAKDTMFAWIDNYGGWITCLYTSHQIFLPAGLDPSTHLYQNGGNNGINAEHSYPQSKGAGNGNPRSDMHHLFPARIGTNSGRGNTPFGEVPDSLTDRWYFLTQELSNPPTQNINEYSERYGLNLFEPREESKGNIARAMFYFYTMYQQQANSADPLYFSSQRLTLCQWHDQDPVDLREWERTWRIAPYQNNRPNPFILDCTLAARTHCPEWANDSSCIQRNTINISRLEQPLSLAQNAFPNPVQKGQILQLPYQLQAPAQIQIQVLSLQTGQVLYQLPTLEHQQSGHYQAQWLLPPSLQAGVYALVWEIQTPQGGYQRLTQKISVYE